MSAREEMAGLLEQWLRISRAEGEAIQEEAWPKLHQIQRQKARLHQPLDLALEKWKMEAPSGTGAEPPAFPFCAEVRHLIALETHHAQLVTARQQKNRAHQLHLERATHNLRKVRNSYVPSRSPAWNSYS